MAANHDCIETGSFQLGGQRFGMVDHHVRPQVQAPLARLGARGGGDHRELRELARQLDQDGADPASAADDQQRLPGATVLRHAQAVEQQFVGSDAGQWQRGDHPPGSSR